MYNCNKRICAGGTQCQCPGTKHTLSTEELDKMTQPKEQHSFGYTREVFREHMKKAEHFGAPAIDAAGGKDGAHFTFFMETFYHHPWFQRVWVVQEAILSSKTVLCSGAEEIPFEELLFINEMASTPAYAGEARWSVQTRDSMPAIWNSLAVSHGRLKTSNSSSSSESVSKQQPMAILDVFLKALDLKATDPRDKLFALLAFGHETKDASTIPRLLRPDYNKPLVNVMADFTRWWILTYNSLDILSYIHCHPTRAWRRTLADNDARLDAPISRPTWALHPDGHAQWAHINLLSQQPPTANADPSPSLVSVSSSPLDASSYSPNPLELPLPGIPLGTILAIDHPPASLVSPENPIPLSSTFHALFDPSARTGVWLLQGTNYHTETWSPGTLCELLDHHTFAHVGNSEALGGGQFVLIPGAKGEFEGRRYEGWNLPACVERCFFVMENGGYGLCPWAARVGDVVVRLRGGRVPVLLRGVEGGERWEFVGEVFVDGIDERDERDERPDEVFVLV